MVSYNNWGSRWIVCTGACAIVNVVIVYAQLMLRRGNQHPTTFWCREVVLARLWASVPRTHLLGQNIIFQHIRKIEIHLELLPTKTHWEAAIMAAAQEKIAVYSLAGKPHSIIHLRMSVYTNYLPQTSRTLLTMQSLHISTPSNSNSRIPLPIYV